MDFLYILGLVYIFSKGGQGCLPFIAIVVLACILAFIFENWLKIIIGLVILVSLLLCIAFIVDYLKYKDETPQERAERLKTEQMIEDWRKRFKKF